MCESPGMCYNGALSKQEELTERDISVCAFGYGVGITAELKQQRGKKQEDIRNSEIKYEVMV